MDDTPESKFIPVDGNYRVEQIADNGAPVIDVNGDYTEVTVEGGLIIEAGNFIRVEFDPDEVPHAKAVI